MPSTISEVWRNLSNVLDTIGATFPEFGPVNVLLKGVSEKASVILLPVGGKASAKPNDDASLVSGAIPGAIQEVVASGAPAVIRDPEVIQTLMPGQKVVGVAIIPISWGEQTLGTINIGVQEVAIDSESLDAWGEKASELARTLVSSRPMNAEHKRDIQLNLINRLGQQDVWKMDLPHFLELAVVSIREGLDYYNVSFFSIDEGNHKLVLTAHAGGYRGRVSKGYSQSMDDGMLGWAVRNRRMLLANDVRKEPNYLAVEGLATRSEICIPVLLEEQTEGVLNVESDMVGAFDEGDVVALEALAQQIADVIQIRLKSQAFDLLKAEMEDRYRFGRLLGRSEPMRKIFELIKAVAKSDMAVLIRGETGTGKELVARAIHEESDRRDRPFIAVNCAALPENLFESELFGHERGAFTGANRRRAGKMELADGGTLFFDEVGEIPTAMQAKLLRSIEGQTFARVGGEEEVQVDVRILSATNRPLEDLEKQGLFRRDLYYRLNAMQIDLPPLRERIEDTSLLAAHFLKEASSRFDKQIDTIAPQVLGSLVAYSWPGNVRELEHVINRAVLLEDSVSLSQVDLPEAEEGQVTSSDGVEVEKMSLKDMCQMALERTEREYLRSLLTQTKGNISRTAKEAGITRRTLYNKMAAYGMRREDFVPSG